MPESDFQHTDVADAFSAIAPIFESTFENEVTAKIRTTVYESIRDVLPHGSSILDINCGVGIDALALAADGYSITGVDVSPGMIDQAAKRSSRNPGLKTEFFVSSFEDLSSLGSRTFDLVLSNFGGLNCSNSLDPVFARVARAIHPKGYFLGVVMPRACFWEISAGLARLRPRSAFRRFQSGVRATGFHQHSFEVHYHPLRRLLSIASPWFDPVMIRGLSLFSPPPHAQAFRNRLPRISKMLDGLDVRVGKLPLLRGMGDHYLVLLQRNHTAVTIRDHQ
ncbi:MAG: class I SAM-dependent methyltransferase [Bacteroidota bacterium]